MNEKLLALQDGLSLFCDPSELNHFCSEHVERIQNNVFQIVEQKSQNGETFSSRVTPSVNANSFVLIPNGRGFKFYKRFSDLWELNPQKISVIPNVQDASNYCRSNNLQVTYNASKTCFYLANSNRIPILQYILLVTKFLMLYSKKIEISKSGRMPSEREIISKACSSVKSVR